MPKNCICQQFFPFDPKDHFEIITHSESCPESEKNKPKSILHRKILEKIAKGRIINI